MTRKLRPGILTKFTRYRRAYGLRAALEHSIVKATARLFPAEFRFRDHPMLIDLLGQGLVLEMGSDILNQFKVPTDAVEQSWNEFREFQRELEGRGKTARLTHPMEFAVESQTSFLLYALVRHFRPSVIVETGVANGYSSFYLLNAIMINNIGQLHSVDITNQVGEVLSEKEKGHWHLHILDENDPHLSFQNLLLELPPIDFFLHDSDHSYQWVISELGSVWKKLSAGAIISADDVDYSYGFLDFCKERQLQPIFLLDSRKIFGLTRKH
jgi:predicted O-methyltransferase YrrM